MPEKMNKQWKYYIQVGFLRRSSFLSKASRLPKKLDLRRTPFLESVRHVGIHVIFSSMYNVLHHRTRVSLSANLYDSPRIYDRWTSPPYCKPALNIKSFLKDGRITPQFCPSLTNFTDNSIMWHCLMMFHFDIQWQTKPSTVIEHLQFNDLSNCHKKSMDRFYFLLS